MYCKFCAAETESKKAICENCMQTNLNKNSFNKKQLKVFGVITALFLTLTFTFVLYSEFNGNSASNLQTTLSNEVESADAISIEPSESLEANYLPETSETLLDSAEEYSSDTVVPFELIILDSLPTANTDTVAYVIGEQQALEWMTTGSLRQIWYLTQAYDEREFCKTSILGTYMGYHGGQSTLQEYADFIGGCTPVIEFWLSNE